MKSPKGKRPKAKKEEAKLQAGKKKDMELEIMKLAIEIAVVIAVFTAAYIFIMTESESYSALYIRSYSNYIENGTVAFTYGVDRFGPAGATYSFEVLERGTTYHLETFDMQPGRRERNVSFALNETVFPVKVQLILTEARSNDVYEAHFWLKGSRGQGA